MLFHPHEAKVIMCPRALEHWIWLSEKQNVLLLTHTSDLSKIYGSQNNLKYEVWMFIREEKIKMYWIIAWLTDEMITMVWLPCFDPIIIFY